MLAEKEKAPTFENCRCPECRHPLHHVTIDTDICPACDASIDIDDVWQTRTYPGIIELPGWLKAFGWPFLLMLAGPAFFAYAYYTAHEIELKIPAAIFSIGFVFFFFKLATNGEEY